MSHPPPPDSPYGFQPPRQDHPRAVLAMILGILGLVICTPVAPFAWVIGKRAVDEIDASRGQLGGRGMAKAGYIMGIIGTAVLVLALLAFIVAIPAGMQIAQSG